MEVIKMNKSHFYRKSIERLLFVLPIFVLLCFAFCISAYAQSVGQEEMMRSIQIINPHPEFSLKLWLDKTTEATYAPGEQIKIFVQVSRDAYVTIYKYDTKSRITIFFPNDLHPTIGRFHAGEIGTIDGVVGTSAQPGIEYIQGFAVIRPISSALIIPDGNLDYKMFTQYLKENIQHLPLTEWVNSNLLSYVINPISIVQLSSPSNGTTLPPGDITFSWNPVSNATKYQFILYNSRGQVALDAIDNGTSSIVALGAEETITWKIRAGDKSGNWGAWSSLWSLTLKSPTTSLPAPTTHPLQGSLHCSDKAGYACPSCLDAPGYINHFKGFNILTTQEDCYVRLVTQDSSSIGNSNDCEVTIKGEKWLGLEDESGRVLAEEINRENFEYIPTNDFAERTMNFPQDHYQYEFADGGKEFRLYLSRNIKDAFQAVPWRNLSVEIKNQKTNKVFTYQFEKGIFPRPYTWSNGVANYGQCIWWVANRWVEEVDSQKLFPFYPPSPDSVNVKKIDSNYRPKEYDILIDYIPGGQPGHYGFVEKVEGDQVYITQFNWVKPGEVYNYISRAWKGKTTDLYYSNNPSDEYYFRYYYRK